MARITPGGVANIKIYTVVTISGVCEITPKPLIVPWVLF